MTITWNWDAALWFALTFFPGTLVHEFGHVFAGWLVGGRGAIIQYGRSPARMETAFRVGRLRFELGWGLGLWFYAPRVRFQSLPDSPLRRLVFSLGGPVASGLLLAAFWPSSSADVVWWFPQAKTWQHWAQWWALWGVVVPLFPMTYPSGLRSDGLQIIHGVADLMRSQK